MEGKTEGKLDLQRFYSTYAKLIGARYKLNIAVETAPSDKRGVAIT